MAPTTISFVCRKGGVGRTTTCMNLAGHYAQQSVRVLCIDLDGQASLSRAFFGSTQVESLRPEQTVAALFAGDTPDLICPTPYDNIHLLPANNAVEPFASSKPSDWEHHQYVIRDYLQTLTDQHDLILIDTPPNTNISTVWSALSCSHYVLSPTPADAFGVQSISSLLDLVAAVQERANPNLLVLGYIISMVQRNSVNGAYRRMLRQLHGSQVLNTEIPLAAAYKEAISERKPVTHFKPRVKASKIVRELADEITARVKSAMKKRKAA